VSVPQWVRDLAGRLAPATVAKATRTGQSVSLWTT
jgi:hypothetical protein